jgi:hypothetical protein
MIRRSKALRTLLTGLALSLVVGAVNCSKGGSNSDTGALRLALSVPGGFTVTTVDYLVRSGAATTLLSGSFDISDPNAAPSLDLALPPSTGDTITLTAHAVGGHTFTGTSTAFNIVSGSTTLVNVTLTDTAGPPATPDGIVIVVGTIVPNDNPPVVDSVVVAPSQTSVGANIGVTAIAHDPDTGDTISYLWSATPDGTFANPASASTTFTSLSPGTKQLRLTVTDNRGSSVIVSNLTVNLVGAAIITQSIGPAGGTLTSPAVTITVPAGETFGPPPTSTTIVLTSQASPGASFQLASGLTPIGTPVVLGPEGTTFTPPITVTLPVPAGTFPVGTVLGSPTTVVQIFTFPSGGGAATVLPTVVGPADLLHVSAQVSHFSGFGTATVTPSTGTGGAGGSAGAAGSVGSGGGVGTGGTVSTGGTAGAASGGAVGTGGAVSTGGTVGTGGAVATGGTVSTGGTVGTGGAAGATSNVGADGLFVSSALLAAADFELNSDAALAAFLDCDATKLSGNTTIVDANGNSWGPNTLGSLGQKLAFTNLLQAINQSIGGPSGITGVATNASNNGPGNRAINGGLLGLGTNPAAITSGTFNGPASIVALYKAAAIADGLKDSTTGTTLTLASTNASFGSAISPVSTNPTTAIGLVNNVVQCAFTASIGVDGNGVVLSPVTHFTHNVVEDLK